MVTFTSKSYTPEKLIVRLQACCTIHVNAEGEEDKAAKLAILKGILEKRRELFESIYDGGFYIHSATRFYINLGIKLGDVESTAGILGIDWLMDYPKGFSVVVKEYVDALNKGEQFSDLELRLITAYARGIVLSKLKYVVNKTRVINLLDVVKAEYSHVKFAM